MNARLPDQAFPAPDAEALQAYVDEKWDGEILPALTDYIAGRQGYDYNQHGQAGNTHADFVPDDVIDRFCLLGTPEQHVERLVELKELGVDQFAVYLQHDNKEETLRVYGESIMPALREHVTAKA